MGENGGKLHPFPQEKEWWRMSFHWTRVMFRGKFSFRYNIFNFKMFHQEASVETIKLIKIYKFDYFSDIFLILFYVI